MKFILKKDLIVKDNLLDIEYENKLFDEGHTFEPDLEGLYDFKNKNGEDVKLTKEKFLELTKKRKDLFEIIEDNDDIELIIEEIPEDDDQLVCNWRIQLDVKTTKKKLMKVEKFIRENINDLI
jgi:hypothetical protein